jgi:uncharacterized cupredoxin-like copper-binding protein
MAYTEKRLVAGSLLGGTVATYYTATAPVLKTIIKEMTFCNTDAATAYTFTLYIVPNGGTAGDSNMEFKTVTLQAGETKIFGRTDVMEQGGSIQALASTASKIAFSCSGVERT